MVDSQKSKATMNLKKLRNEMRGLEVQPVGNTMERIMARVTGQVSAVQVSGAGLSFRAEGEAFGSEAELGAYLNSKMPAGRIANRK